MVSSKPIKYSLDEIAEQRMYRSYTAAQFRRSPFYKHAAADVTQRLKDLAPTSWLSIHRATGPRSARDEHSHEFTVDQKLDEISNSLVRLFSELKKRSTDEAHKFQETVFLSLIYEHKEDELIRAVQNLDLDREQDALVDILNNFNVPESFFLARTRKHFTALAAAVDHSTSAPE